MKNKSMLDVDDDDDDEKKDLYIWRIYAKSKSKKKTIEENFDADFILEGNSQIHPRKCFLIFTIFVRKWRKVSHMTIKANTLWLYIHNIT